MPDSLKDTLKKALKSEVEAVVREYEKDNEDDKSSSEGEKQNIKEDSFRTVFEKECDKVIFSDYFRALSDKTQVVPLSESDHNHSRLTHSLEVGSVGRSLGYRLCTWLFEGSEDPEERETMKNLPQIIKTACLLHDIGNPPFGHAGENAIKHVFKKLFKVHVADNNKIGKYEPYRSLNLDAEALKDFIHFDGNANGFRIAAQLAGKREEIATPDQSKYRLDSGLGLSKITLAAGLKYPFPAEKHPTNKDKYGYFKAEQEIFQWVTGSYKGRHPLVYLVEAADDICNLVMDFEDAIKNGHTQPIRLFSDLYKECWGKKGDLDFIDIINGNNISDAEIVAKLKEILQIKGKTANQRAKNLLGYVRHLKKFDKNCPYLVKDLKAIEGIRAEVIGLLIRIVCTCFEQNLQTILNGQLFNEQNTSQIGLLDKYFSSRETPSGSNMLQAIENLRKKYLYNSLYCHKRKAEIEVSGYQITEFLLTLFLDAVAEYKEQIKFDTCSTRTQHLLRYLGINYDNELDTSDSYLLCLRVTDFYTKASDREITLLYQALSGYRYL